ncbi:MAG TPA: molybdopterin oxidoreductase [Betaproteobacteria bacterium]|nr:molybdopterin oxidoreductase [Betaproteobacteria bacterium]
MKSLVYREIPGRSAGFYALLGGLGLFILAGLTAAYMMDKYGHIITGMNDQVVWGLPHVFAVFLIVAASGALNVASVGTVFSKTIYQPLGRLSALLAMALLAGGLTVLMLDLGRPDRVIIAMTHYNFRSVFAWNVFLYSGFFAFTAIYLWTMMERRMGAYKKSAGVVAFVWRLILTTGTGSIFGFLVARELYDSALLAPMFIAFSFSYGLAIFVLVLMAAYGWTGRPLGDLILQRLRKLLGVLVAASLYFVIVYHLTNTYFAAHRGVEAFILLHGGIYTALFWVGQVFVGSLLPLAIIFHPRLSKSRSMIAFASILVIAGGLAQMYVTIIGGQAYHLVLFPGYQEASSFFDGVNHHYTPSVAEFFLGLGGVAITCAITVVGMKVLRFLPESLDDQAVDPHAAAKS